jgi:hypothetical protein
MTVYVDPAVFKKPGGRKRYCHVASDTEAELHAFAERLGLKRHFFHAGAKHVHYDLAEERRPAALAAGAVEVTSRELARIARPRAETQAPLVLTPTSPAGA